MLPCEIRGCSNPAQWLPVLEFRSADNAQPHEKTLALGVCQKCRERMTAEDYLTDRGFEIAKEAIVGAGHEAPNRDLTTVRYRRISG